MKTKRDLFDEVYRRYGIQTSARFHVNLDEKMSDEDYQESLEMYSKIQGMRIPNWSKDDLKKKLSKKDLLEFLIGVYGDEIMNREIKFRAWHMPLGEKGPFQEMIYKRASSILSFAEMDPDSYIVEEFIGLKDGNGKDIYEGDILKVKMQDSWQTVPELVKHIWDPHVWINESDPYYAVTEMLIIGNIHENPELLEAHKHD